ncbi:MAG: replication-associated recombination protein A [Christensenella sp.]|uniref:replication-associated recombination protein A n=1 Tax=Christensenella sp. TaxID=1935934 RepID=UPI002B21D23C|nr:replication-associated recombination protein A [Christensenella sp.]MEA5001978.1 replication-associated recombination protein A [Christensenella sp.]
MQDLFSGNLEKSAPLADRMRPRTLDEFLGQEHVVGKNTLLRRAIEADKLGSCIFWGPPGCGKSTLAAIIAGATGSDFYKLNAVTSGVKDVREIIDQAESNLKMYGRESFLLLDECHRWSKSQSDSVLPAMESGVIKLIGSTTENPMAAMTSAIVSRCRLFEFYALTVKDVEKAIHRAAGDEERGFGHMDLALDDDAVTHWASVSNGDIRSALNALELAVLTTKPDKKGKIHITLAIAEQSIQQRAVRMDDNEYYDMLSAFCKSLRGSDSDAALFWFARMIYAGVDPRVPVRRMIAHASEDVGLANPSVLNQCVAAMQALDFNGMPEARLNIAQAIIYLCESPKSNSVLLAVDAAARAAREVKRQDVPAYLQDTNFEKAKHEKKGKDYKYVHDYPRHYVEQQYLPDELKGAVFYRPSMQGYEQKVHEYRRFTGKEKKEQKPE